MGMRQTRQVVQAQRLAASKKRRTRQALVLEAGLAGQRHARVMLKAYGPALS